jgi:hypothetical protein
MSEITEVKSEGSPEMSKKFSPVEDKKILSKPPFKLCFVLHEELGRSHILPSKSKKVACELYVYCDITCKFIHFFVYYADTSYLSF